MLHENEGLLPEQPPVEGKVARAIEKRTARVPSDVFLWSALGAMGASVALDLFGQKKLAGYLAQWAPAILILGLYNKLVKLGGSDAYDLAV